MPFHSVSSWYMTVNQWLSRTPSCGVKSNLINYLAVEKIGKAEKNVAPPADFTDPYRSFCELKNVCDVPVMSKVRLCFPITQSNGSQT